MTVRLLAALFLLACAPLGAQAPYIDPADDPKHFGPPQPLTWTLHQKVAGFRNYDKIFLARTVEAGAAASLLPERPSERLANLRFDHGGRAWSLDEYFVQTNVAGLLVLHRGRIAYERYGLGNARRTRWVSYSVAKSVTSLLVGAALRDGYIESLDEPVTRYLPRLRGSAYEQTTIADLLRMASGVAWDETYDDPDSDVYIEDWGSLFVQRYLAAKPRVARAGAEFNYNTAETNLVGTLVRAAIGNNLSTYLSEKIWKPFGMEADALWTLTEAGGGEFGGCCLSATLRDYARIGLFALRGGNAVLPQGWMRKSTLPSPANPAYGYLWWLAPGGAYRASGIFGQRIYVDPRAEVVIAQHAAREAASDDRDWALQAAMEAAVAAALDSSQPSN